MTVPREFLAVMLHALHICVWEASPNVLCRSHSAQSGWCGASQHSHSQVSTESLGPVWKAWLGYWRPFHSTSIALLAWAVCLGLSSGSPGCFPPNVTLGIQARDFMAAELRPIPFPRSVPWHHLVLKVKQHSLDLNGLGFALTCTLNCWDLIYSIQVCVLPNHVQLIEYDNGGLLASCRHIERRTNGNTVIQI